MGTPLVGKKLLELQLRKQLGVNVVGFWDHGAFIEARPDYKINNSTVLVIIGTKEKVDLYNENFVIFSTRTEPAIIIGSGRVGQFVANSLKKRGIGYVIIESDNKNVILPNKTIIGNAADYKVLEKAGIQTSPSIIISTSNDDMNIYLTIYCRRLRPDIQIISRANTDKNISTLNRAGADLVMSYPSLTANAVFNFLKQNKILMLSEGIDIFTATVAEKLVGKNLLNSKIRQNTGCNVIAIKKDGKTILNPDPELYFNENDTLIIIGKKESEKKFIDLYH